MEEQAKEEELAPLRQGWIGPMDNLLYVLAMFHADKDESGAFLIYGKPIAVGLGGDEAVVPGETEYSVQGKRANLAGALNSTSYGLKVAVIS
jgi:hypothetical protein